MPLAHEHSGEQSGLEHHRKRPDGPCPRQRARRERRDLFAQPFAEIERRASTARRRGIGLDVGHQLLHRTRRGGTERLVRHNRFGKVFAHRLVLGGKVGIGGKGALDHVGFAAAQRAGSVPRQEGFDLLALGSFRLEHRIHGQPLSTPAALSSSPNRFRA